MVLETTSTGVTVSSIDAISRFEAALRGELRRVEAAVVASERGLAGSD